MNKILPILRTDLTKYATNDGEHLIWSSLQSTSGTTTTNMTVSSQYLLYTSKSTTDKNFYKKSLDVSATTFSLTDLTLFETYLIQLIVESGGNTYTSNTHELRVNNARPFAPVIESVVELDDGVMVNVSYPSNNGGVLSHITFILNDGVNIFSISKSLATTPSSKIALSISDNVLLANYKTFEMSVFSHNVRGNSEISDKSVEFSPTDFPNSPTLVSAIESDQKLTISWQKPNDYALWFVESYTSLVHIQYKKSSDVDWIESALVDTKVVDILTYDITQLQNGQLYDVRVAYQNDIGLGQFSNVMTGLPFTKSVAPVASLFNLESDFIQIKAVLPSNLNGLDFVSCQCDVYEIYNGSRKTFTLIDTVYKSEFVFSFMESQGAYLFLQNRRYTFKVYINTQSQLSNNKNLIKGDESSVEEIVYYNII
jgi:hypothetical protein